MILGGLVCPSGVSGTGTCAALCLEGRRALCERPCWDVKNLFYHYFTDQVIPGIGNIYVAGSVCRYAGWRIKSSHGTEAIICTLDAAAGKRHRHPVGIYLPNLVV